MVCGYQCRGKRQLDSSSCKNITHMPPSPGRPCKNCISNKLVKSNAYEGTLGEALDSLGTTCTAHFLTTNKCMLWLSQHPFRRFILCHFGWRTTIINFWSSVTTRPPKVFGSGKRRLQLRGGLACPIPITGHLSRPSQFHTLPTTGWRHRLLLRHQHPFERNLLRKQHHHERNIFGYRPDRLV